MKHTTFLTVALALIAFVLAIAVQPVQAQDVVPAVQTRVAEVKEKAQSLGADREAVDEAVNGVAAFRATAQAALSTQLDPLLVQPTRIPRGRGQRVYRCLQQRYDRNSRTWICVRTGR